MNLRVTFEKSDVTRRLKTKGGGVTFLLLPFHLSLMTSGDNFGCAMKMLQRGEREGKERNSDNFVPYQYFSHVCKYVCL